jgi:hypothetical protein
LKKTKRSKRVSYGIAGVKKNLYGKEDLVLEGTMVAIDPSCISASSLPGYAIFDSGSLIETGVIEGISYTETLEKRLQFLGAYVRDHFDPDILAIEHITPGGKFGSTIPSLIRATGAIIGSTTCEVVSISPLAWQAFIEFIKRSISLMRKMQR